MQQNQKKKREKTLNCLYNCLQRITVLEAIVLSSKKKPYSLFHYLLTPIHLTIPFTKIGSKGRLHEKKVAVQNLTY